MDETAKVEVAGKARFNYAGVFVGRAEASGLSSLPLGQVPFTGPNNHWGGWLM